MVRESRTAGALGALWRLAAIVWEGSLFGRLSREAARAGAAWPSSLAGTAARRAARRLEALRPWAAGSALLRAAPLDRLPAYLAMAFPLLPTSLDVALIWAAAVALLLRRWARGQALLRRPAAAWPLGLFAAAVAISALASVTPLPSLVSLVLWLSQFLLFLFMFEAVTSPAAVRGVQWSLALGAALTSVIGLAQAYAGIQTPRWIDEQANPGLSTRVFSVFDDPNALASYFTATLPFIAALVLSERRWLLKLGALTLLGVTLAGDLYTFSRGGWLAAVLAFAILGSLWRPRYFPLAWAAMAAALAALVAAGPHAIQVRLESLASGQDTSIQYRFAIWTGVLHMVRAYLWTGVGLGQSAFAAVYPHFMIAGTEAAHAHDIYLELLAETGLPGLLLFLWLAAALAFTFLRAALRRVASGAEGTRLAAAAALAACVALLFEGLTDNVWFSPRAAMGLWLGAGLGAACARLLRAAGAPGEAPAEAQKEAAEGGAACASST
ncbi:MAG: O-antigen ligase family protein [Firmicutes bacterium]|nr:O-antigen ligase family protein [Bacillota bacterium]